MICVCNVMAGDVSNYEMVTYPLLLYSITAIFLPLYPTLLLTTVMGDCWTDVLYIGDGAIVTIDCGVMTIATTPAYVLPDRPPVIGDYVWWCWPCWCRAAPRYGITVFIPHPTYTLHLHLLTTHRRTAVVLLTDWVIDLDYPYRDDMWQWCIVMMTYPLLLPYDIDVTLVTGRWPDVMTMVLTL